MIIDDAAACGGPGHGLRLLLALRLYPCSRHTLSREPLLAGTRVTTALQVLLRRLDHRIGPRGGVVDLDLEHREFAFELRAGLHRGSLRGVLRFELAVDLERKSLDRKLVGRHIFRSLVLIGYVQLVGRLLRGRHREDGPVDDAARPEGPISFVWGNFPPRRYG